MWRASWRCRCRIFSWLRGGSGQPSMGCGLASAPPGHRLKHPSATTCPSMGRGLASARPGHLLKHPSAVFSSSPRGRRCGSLQLPPMAWRNESQQTDNAAQPSVWPTCPTRPTCPTWPTRSSCPLLHDARVYRVILTPLGVSERALSGRPGAVRGRRRPPRCGHPQPNIRCQSEAAVLGAARFRPQGVRRAPHAEAAVVSAPATPLDDQRARIRCRRSAHASSVTERE